MSAALNYISAFCAATAAVLWFWSASVPIPKYIRRIDLGDFGGSRDGETEPAEMDDLQKLTVGLASQSTLSALAALAAGLAAACQALATSVSTH